MTFKPAHVCALVALLGAGCGDPSGTPAGAARGPDHGDRGATAAERPRYADQDRDGRVTRAEAQADPALAAAFDRYDDDADGALDRAEFARLEAGAAPRPRHTLRPRGEYPRPSE